MGLLALGTQSSMESGQHQSLRIPDLNLCKLVKLENQYRQNQCKNIHANLGVVDIEMKLRKLILKLKKVSSMDLKAKKSIAVDAIKEVSQRICMNKIIRHILMK